MATVYPIQIDTSLSLPKVVDNITPFKGFYINQLTQAIIAIEASLGTVPQGLFTTVANRLTNIESLIGIDVQGAVHLGGDIGGTNFTPIVIGIQGRPIASNTPGPGEILTWTGSQWSPLPPGDITAGFVVTLSGPNFLEFGQALINPIFSATYSNPAVTGHIQDNIGGPIQNIFSTPAAGSPPVVPPAIFVYNQSYEYSVPTTITFSFTASDSILTTTTPFNATWTQRLYYGTSSPGGSTGLFIRTLSNNPLTDNPLTSHAGFTFTANASAGQAIYFAYRTAYGLADFWVDGFEGGFNLISTTISVTNEFGFTENYTLYQSSQVNLGVITVDVFFSGTTKLTSLDVFNPDTGFGNLFGDAVGSIDSNTVVAIRGTPVSTNSVANDGFALVSTGGVYVPAGVVSVFNVKNFGAKGDGSNDDTAAFIAAVVAKDASTNGGEIFIPAGIYKLTSTIDLGTKKFIVRGIGYHNTTTDIFGSSSWPTEVLGSVLHFTNNTDGLTVSATNFLGSTVRDLALIGPGTGTTTGINFTGTVPFVTLDGIGIFNFGVAFNPGNQESVSHTRTQITGCATGIKLDSSPTNLQFFNTVIQFCNDGILATTGELLQFYGGLIQACLRGINLKGGTEWGFDGIWFEGNGKNQNPTIITTTSANYTQPAQGSTVIVQMASTVGLIAGEGCHIAGGGDYAVQSLNIDGIHATLVNLFNGGNASPTTVINSGANVNFGGAYAGPDLVLDVSTTSITNLLFARCRFASDWFMFYEPGSTGTVNDITFIGCLIGQTLTIPARMFNVLISGCSTAAIINNSTGPVTLINTNDNGTVTDNAGGVQGFGINDSVLGDFVPIVGGALASTSTNLDLKARHLGYTRFYDGTTPYLGIKRDSGPNIHIDVLDSTAGGLFVQSGNANQEFEVSFAGSGSNIFLTSPTIELADATPVVRFRVTSAKAEFNAPIAGHTTLGSPLDISNATPPTSSGSNHTLTSAEYTCPNIVLGTATLSGTGTTLTFPNKRGLWLVDSSNITFGGQTFTLLAGSGAGSQTMLTGTSNTLFWVQCTGNNDIREVIATQKISVTNITHATPTYNVLATDHILAVDTTGGAITIDLPASPNVSDIYQCKDIKGTASTNNITIDSGSGNKIDAAQTFVMNINYGSVTLVCIGTSPTQWSIL